MINVALAELNIGQLLADGSSIGFFLLFAGIVGMSIARRPRQQ